VDYQAIVMQLLDIKTLPDAEPNPRPLPAFTLKVFKYDSVPLVEKMGLLVDHAEKDANTTIEVIEIKSAGVVEASMREKGAINFGWRQGNSPWKFPDDPLVALEALAPGIVTKMRTCSDDLEKIPMNSQPKKSKKK
jgi:hypothetical protein